MAEDTEKGPEPLTMSVKKARQYVPTMGKNQFYEACNSGAIPNVRVNKTIQILIRPFMRKFGAEA